MSYAICTWFTMIEAGIENFDTACQQAKDKSEKDENLKNKFLMVVNEENAACAAFKNGVKVPHPHNALICGAI